MIECDAFARCAKEHKADNERDGIESCGQEGEVAPVDLQEDMGRPQEEAERRIGDDNPEEEVPYRHKGDQQEQGGVVPQVIEERITCRDQVAMDKRVVHGYCSFPPVRLAI